MRATRLALLLLALPLPAAASSVKINTDPAGASVQLDGTAYGTSPVKIPKVTPGTHLLKVTMEGYTPREDSVEVAGDQDVEIQVPMAPKPKVVEPAPKPAPPPQPTPSPTPVYQPTQQVQQLPPSNPQPTLPPVVAPQTQAPLPVSENPVKLGVAKKTLVLTVETTPANASVQVVGMPTVKPAPAIFTGFSRGVLRVLVKAPGYQDKTVEIELDGDVKTLVALDRAP